MNWFTEFEGDILNRFDLYLNGEYDEKNDIIVAECIMKDEIELEDKPSGADLLKIVDDVNERFKETGLKIPVDRLRATHISDPIEEDVDHDI